MREMCCSVRGSDRRWDRNSDLSFEHDAEKMHLISGTGDDVVGVSCNDLRTHSLGCVAALPKNPPECELVLKGKSPGDPMPNDRRAMPGAAIRLWSQVGLVRREVRFNDLLAHHWPVRDQNRRARLDLVRHFLRELWA